MANASQDIAYKELKLKRNIDLIAERFCCQDIAYKELKLQLGLIMACFSPLLAKTLPIRN